MSNKTRVLKFLGILMVLGLIFVALPVHQAEAATGATWYVCPGSGICDFETIQAAIDAAGDGDIILVEPGTYAEEIILSTPNITIQSTGGPEVTIIDSPFGDLTSGVWALSGMGTLTFDGFTVQNFTENGIVQSMGNHDGTEFHVLNNIVIPYNGYLRNGIQVSGDGSTVVGNTIYGAPLTDSWASSAIMVVNGSNVEVLSNWIEGGTLGVDIGISIMNYGGVVDNVVVANNTTTDAGNGIRLSGNAPATTMTNVSVTANDFGYGGMGFNVQNLTVDTVSVTGNNFHDNETAGFRFSSSSATVSNATISGNTFTNNYYQFLGGTMSEVEFAPVPGANTFDKVVTTTNWPVDIYSMIQTGIDESVEGDIVNVSSGTYVEQVVINKSIDLIGAGDSIIEAPATLTAYQFPESTKWWEPVVFAYGGTVDGSYVITGTDVIDVTITGFEVDGLDRVPGSGHRAAGILLRNADGLVSSNVVRNMLIDGSETFGIIAYGDSAITIDSNNVSGWARGGIAANGDAGANADPVATITNNTVAGPGMNEIVTWAPNGIQIGWGATGSIEGNTVTGNGWPGTDWSGTGILVFAADDVLIDGNYVADNESGIAVGGDLWYGTGPAENNVISNNTVENNTYGVSIQSASDYTVISSNLITGSYYDGIDVWGDPKPIGTQIEMNQIVGNNVADDATSGGLWIQDGVATVDASPNWWGSAVGPYEGQIIGSAEFAPWCGDENCLTFMPNGDGEIVLPPDVTEEEIQTAINNAPSGSTVVIPAGSYTVPGGFVVNSNGVTILLSDGAHIENNSPCFVINADYTTITGDSLLGATCVPTSGSNGIDVAAGLTNIVIEGFEIDGSTTGGTEADGINFAGVVTDLNIADMYIHDMPDAGLFFAAEPANVVQIQGNLFMDNGGNGIESGALAVPADYNSWGSADGPIAGDGISTGVDADVYTHADLYIEPLDLDYPYQVYLGEQIAFEVRANLVNAMGADFVLAYPEQLSVVSAVSNAAFDWELEIADSGSALHFVGAQSYGSTPLTGDILLYTVTFEGASVGTGLTLDFDETSDVFSMFAGADSISTNIYATELTDATGLEVNAFPTITIVPSGDPVYAGLPVEFTVDIDNTDGRDLASVGLDFTLPAGAVLEYWNGLAWVDVTTDPYAYQDALGVPGTTSLAFRVTFVATGANVVTVDLYDLTPDPDTLLASDDETFTALGDFTVSGTVAMQGRTTRSGVPLTLTDVSGKYAPVDISSTFEISNNVLFTGLNAEVYQITTAQPRYLNVSAEMERMVAVFDNVGLPALELKGGNAVWTDNVIDLSDASYVGGQYGEPIFDDGDVNFDDRVNIQDLALVGGNYGLTSEVAYEGWPGLQEISGVFEYTSPEGHFTATISGAYNFVMLGQGFDMGNNITTFGATVDSGDFVGCEVTGIINAQGTDVLYAEITCGGDYAGRFYGSTLGDFEGWLVEGPARDPISTVEVTGPTTVVVGSTIDLDVLLDGAAPDRPVWWAIYVDDSAIAEIDLLTGELTGLSAGDALVIVTVVDDSNVSHNNTFHVTVTAP